MSYTLLAEPRAFLDRVRSVVGAKNEQLYLGSSLSVFPVSHVSLAISDQPYGVKEPSVGILSPRKGWDVELTLVALERAV